MSKISKKTIYCLIISLACVNLMFRYPFFGHEVNSYDSFAIHGIANALVQYGHAQSVVDPLSYIGLYPYSYPMGLPFLEAAAKQIFRIDMEAVIIVVSCFFALLAMLAVFLLVKEILENDIAALFSAFAYSTAPMFVNATFFACSARGLFTALLPILVLLIVTILKKRFPLKKSLPLLLIFLAALFFTHRVATLALPLLICVLTAVLLFFTANRCRNRLGFILRRRYFAPIVLTCMFGAVFTIQFLALPIYKFTGFETFYRTGFFFEGDALHIQLLNLFTNYAGKIGLLVFVSVIGALYVVFKKTRTLLDWFLIVSLLFFTSVLTVGLYTPWVLLPFASILAGMGFLALVKMLKLTRKRAFAIFVPMLIASSCLTGLLLHHWATSTYEKRGFLIAEPTYNAAIYCKYYMEDGLFVPNDITTGEIVTLFAGIPYPSGRITYFGYGILNWHELKLQLRPLSDWGIGMKSFFIYNEISGQYEIIFLANLHPDHSATKMILQKWSIKYAVESTCFSGENAIIWGHPVVKSQFFKSLPQTRYQLFNNGDARVYWLG